MIISKVGKQDDKVRVFIPQATYRQMNLQPGDYIIWHQTSSTEWTIEKAHSAYQQRKAAKQAS